LAAAAEELIVVSTTPMLDVEILLGKVLQKGRAFLFAHTNDELTGKQIHEFWSLVEQRQLGVPIAYIVGYKEFWNDVFIVNSSVLVPRPETELLVQSALEIIKKGKIAHNINRSLRILELGVGSGCVIISIVKELLASNIDLEAIGVDISPQALDVCRHNLINLGVKDYISLRQGNWFAALNDSLADSSISKNEFDIIVTNPPYVEQSYFEQRRSSIATIGTGFEPSMALYAGVDGLVAIQHILMNFKNYLASNGVLMCEIGSNQKLKIESYFQSWSELQDFQCRFLDDLAGLTRVLVVERKR
jgi:release factor glutamine methyltransferase